MPLNEFLTRQPLSLSTQDRWLPMVTSNRLPLLDILRGFALIGILLMNIECYVGPLNEGSSGLNYNFTGSDRWVDALVYILIQGKFYTLFSFLFGCGFALLNLRSTRLGHAFTPFYLRRMAALFVFGLIHAILIWSGDILVTYAVWGSLMLLTRRLPTAALPFVAFVVYMSIPIILFINAWLDVWLRHQPGLEVLWQQMQDQTAQDFAQVLRAQRFALEKASFFQACHQRLGEFLASVNGILTNGLPVFACFLVGRWCVEAGVLKDNGRWQQQFGPLLRWRIWPCGLACMVLSFVIAPSMNDMINPVYMALAYLLGQVANGLMCLGYIAMIAHFSRVLSVLSSMGRMSLSLYLMQSLICTWLFSGYGLALHAYLNRTWQVPFALALCAVQWIFSRWWFKHFQFGPVEWLWRSISYWHWQPLRRSTFLAASR